MFFYVEAVIDVGNVWCPGMTSHSVASDGLMALSRRQMLQPSGHKHNHSQQIIYYCSARSAFFGNSVKDFTT